MSSSESCTVFWRVPALDTEMRLSCSASLPCTQLPCTSCHDFHISVCMHDCVSLMVQKKVQVFKKIRTWKKSTAPRVSPAISVWLLRSIRADSASISAGRTATDMGLPSISRSIQQIARVGTGSGSSSLRNCHIRSTAIPTDDSYTCSLFVVNNK